MKKIISAFLFTFAALSVSAQINGIDNDNRFGVGEDSIHCIELISICNTNVKNKSYTDAYVSWKELFNRYPVARVDTYTNGVKILKGLIAEETDEQKKLDYINELMAVYDQQIKYIDKLQAITKTKITAGNTLGKKALDYIKFMPKASLDSAYAMVSQSVSMEKGMSEYNITQQLMKLSAMKYKKDPAGHGESVIQDYLDASVYIVDVLDKYNERIAFYTKRYEELRDPKDSVQAEQYRKAINAARIARSNIDGYFINSGAASCDDLEAIYAPKIEENKDNIAYLNKVISLMSMLKCTNQDAYLTASEYALAIEPTAKAAMGCGYRYFKRGEIEKAMEFFDQAIELEHSVTNKADMCYKVGAVYMNLKKYSKAREYARKALELNPQFGEAYILIAQCYAAAPNWGNDNVLNGCTYFAAIDKLQRAKAVDSTVKDEANKLIAQYSKYTPAKDELFMRGYNEGKSITIGGWINETTTIR